MKFARGLTLFCVMCIVLFSISQNQGECNAVGKGAEAGNAFEVSPDEQMFENELRRLRMIHNAAIRRKKATWKDFFGSAERF